MKNSEVRQQVSHPVAEQPEAVAERRPTVAGRFNARTVDTMGDSVAERRSIGDVEREEASRRAATRWTGDVRVRGLEAHSFLRTSLRDSTGAWVLLLGFLLAFMAPPPSLAADGTNASPGVEVEVKQATLEGRLDGEAARFTLQAVLGGLTGTREPALVSTRVWQAVRVTRERVRHTFAVELEALRGHLREVALPLGGEGEVLQVTGEGLEDWSVRRGLEGGRSLVVRLKPSGPPIARARLEVVAETEVPTLPATVSVLTLTGEPAALGSGYVRVEGPLELEIAVTNAPGLIPIAANLLPETFPDAPGDAVALAGLVQAFRFQGEAYSLPLRLTVGDPEARAVVLTDFRLVGDLGASQAAFTLTAVARVRNPAGGVLDLLSGPVALEEPGPATGWELRHEGERFWAVFRQAGEYPVRLRFDARVESKDGWSGVNFRLAAGALAPLTLRGLSPDTQVRVAEAARPGRDGDAFTSFLPASGRVGLSWRAARSETEGKLFYAAEAVTQVAVSSGLLRQTTFLDLKVMQGELNRVELRLEGDSHVEFVQGPQVLSWEISPVPGGSGRRLLVQFNQPQRDQATIHLQQSRQLGAFPLAIETVRLEPVGATRFGGYVRVVNIGAVRLEVVEASGLSQISPDQFVQTEVTKALLPPQSTQIFAYRFAGADHALRVQADTILPELSVSAVLVHRLGETELSVDAEFEVDVREAPLRELVLRVPKGYSLARLTASGLSDHFLTEPADAPDAQLRLLYGTPVIGRQVISLRLERNQPLGESRWVLPRVDVVKARSVRGHLGVVADAGFRVTPAQTTGLTELAPAFFPKKIPGLQAAFRLADPAWQAAFSVERLAQSLQVDAFHLFSVGEGIAYGSSLLNYVVSGAPVSTLRVELSGEYFNVEFTGKNIRNWQKADRGYEVQLHTPVSGVYPLLVTYERPFKSQGETLAFTGARPVDAQTEQGYTLVISTYQFEVRPVTVSGSLVPIETGEVPAEYRLFFDAPILAAYRYTARPFNLELELRPLVQGATVSQVVDRADLTTRISDEGQVVTEARYFVKNKGAPNLRLRLPEGAELWSVTLDGVAVVPVKDEQGNLIPLPHRADPDVVSELRVKIASKARDAERLEVAAPVISAPVLLAEWRLEPAGGRRLVYRGGTLTPANGITDASGFAGLSRMFTSRDGSRAWAGLGVLLASLLACGFVWSWSASGGAARLSLRHLLAGLLGAVAAFIAVITLFQLLDLAGAAGVDLPRGLRFMAPVQQADVAWRVELGNEPIDASRFALLPVLLSLAGLVLWGISLIAGRAWWRRAGLAGAWTLIAWAALRTTNGAPAFFLVALTFVVLHVLLPSARRWWQSPPRAGSPTPATGMAVVIAFALGLGTSLVPGSSARAAEVPLEALLGPGGLESVEHQVRVEDDFVFGTARVRWNATQGQALPLFREPGVLTRSGHPTNRVRLVPMMQDGHSRQVLVAETNGWVDFTLDYQVRVVAQGTDRGFMVPVSAGLVNHARVTLRGLDVDVISPQAVTVQREAGEDSTNTVVSLVLVPSDQTWIAWRPRTRDTRREKSVFFAETVQLLMPGPGVVEGLHDVQLRPAQGEVGELVLIVPPGATITDVASPALAFWRFDPDTRRLRVSLSPAQAKPFRVQIRSQIATTPLPFEGAAGLLSVEGASGQLGVVGVATGMEVQLEDVKAEGFSVINLEDFPGGILRPLATQVPGLTLRRAFRYSGVPGTLTLAAAAVEPDVRVEAQQTLSLGEDRTVLAVTLDVEVLRAGIFKLSFPLPTGLDVESVSGGALSHWTELKTGEERVVTLHLKGKTEGRHQFAVTLTGAGVRSITGWRVPRLALREATKQRGQLMVVPEQGLRLQVARREGATQLDPLQSGVRQKGVLAFRLLQDVWTLDLDLERVDAWVQVTGLQHLLFGEAQVKATANLQYEIENTGVKSLLVRLPPGAENVRFRGESVTDFLQRPPEAGSTNRDWEIKLERRILGRYALQVIYTLALGEAATEAVIEGVQALEVNLQRGFVAVQAGGRLQVRIDSAPGLQPTEWQIIPRALLQDLTAPSASYTFRLVEPAFRVRVQLERREATRLLPARVNEVTLTSVISDDGAMLTQVRMQLVPGDKRLLHLTLPVGSRFWFAFVNQNSVWPWQSTNQVLLPLEQNSRIGEPTTVEFFYSGTAGKADPGALDLDLLGPKFDLPLENIVWHVHLNEKWRIRDWDGTLQLREDGGVPVPGSGALDLDSYIRNEAQIRQSKTKEAEEFLSLANNLLQQGDPQQARRAFRAAYGMSQHDQAFNEDARVQLNNLKVQQALVGLNVRQARVAGDAPGQGPGQAAAAPRALWDNVTANYSQSEAKQLLERNSAEETAVQQRLAERLIQQQDAAVANPAAIRAAIPEQGRRLTFTRPLEVNTWAELRIGLEATAAGQVSWWWRLRTLALVFLGLLVAACAVRRSAVPS